MTSMQESKMRVKRINLTQRSFPTEMNHQAKKIIDDDLERTIRNVLSPLDKMKKPIEILPYHGETYLNESKLIYVKFPFLTEQGTTLMIQHHQVEEMERMGYKFVSVDADAKKGMTLTFIKEKPF